MDKVTKSHGWQVPIAWLKLALVIGLAGLAAIAIVPAYITGQWPWVNLPQVAQMERLQTLQQEGLPLPGWQMTDHQPVTINRQAWSLGEYQAEGDRRQAGGLPSVAVLLRPQPWHSDQPQIEWLDLQGVQAWQIDRSQSLRIPLPPTLGTVQARWLQAQNDHQSLAVAQWYAWPRGGHPAPSRWFWANMRSQLSDRRLTPWVAVAVLIPMPPQADLDPYEPLARDLIQQIQQQLVSTVFQY